MINFLKSLALFSGGVGLALICSAIYNLSEIKLHPFPEFILLVSVGMTSYYLVNKAYYKIINNKK